VPQAELVERISREAEVEPDLAALTEHPTLLKALGEAVARVNAELSPIERLRRFIVAREPFTTANGQMTPTLKIKRHAIRQAYGEALLKLYEAKG
jgi:long-chain acyl-CoA synthetase